MSTVASTSFLPVLASTMPGVTLNLGEVQRLEFTKPQAVALVKRIEDQRIGEDDSEFFNILDKMIRTQGPRGNSWAENFQRLSQARNDLSSRLQLDASIAAAHVVGKKGRISEKFLGVLGPRGEGVADLKDSRGKLKFDNPGAEVFRAVGARGPLGRAEIRKVKEWALEQGITVASQSIFDAAQEQTKHDLLKPPQLFFLSALLLQEEGKNEKPTGSVSLEIGECLMWAAKTLYMAGQLSTPPANQYFEDIIGLRLAAVQLSPNALKVPRLAALQEAVAEFLESPVEKGRPRKESQLITSALYFLDSAANWNNARPADEVEESREATFAIFNLIRGLALLQRAGRLPVQAG